MPEHFKDQLLDVVFHYMGMDMRRRLMVEVPMAYNLYVERDVCEVLVGGDELHSGSRAYHVELHDYRAVIQERRGPKTQTELIERS